MPFGDEFTRSLREEAADTNEVADNQGDLRRAVIEVQRPCVERVMHAKRDIRAPAIAIERGAHRRRDIDC